MDRLLITKNWYDWGWSQLYSPATNSLFNYGSYYCQSASKSYHNGIWIYYDCAKNTPVSYTLLVNNHASLMSMHGFYFSEINFAYSQGLLLGIQATFSTVNVLIIKISAEIADRTSEWTVLFLSEVFFIFSVDNAIRNDILGKLQ